MFHGYYYNFFSRCTHAVAPDCGSSTKESRPSRRPGWPAEESVDRSDVVLDAGRIVSVPAGVAPVLGIRKGASEARERELVQHLVFAEADTLLDRFDIAAEYGSDEMVLDIDSVVARVPNGRCRDHHDDLFRLTPSNHADELAYRRAPDDRIVDQHDCPAADQLGDRIEFFPDRAVACSLRMLDERTSDIVAFH